MAALALLCGCEVIESGSARGRDTERDDPSGDGEVQEDSTLVTPAPAPKPDTLVYLSAVHYPDGYDWQRDTAYRSGDARLSLYCNDSLLLRFPTGEGISAEPDMHHIIGGHLFTEGVSGGRTVICRDGEEVLRFDGKELLKGLLPVGNDLYTLSQERSGSGFTLRRNGEAVLRKSGGVIFGSLDDPSYGSSGALYLQNGICCFCYRVGEVCLSVWDGQERTLTEITQGSRVQDLKIVGGEAVAVKDDSFGLFWDGARIWDHGNGDVSVSGNIRNTAGGTRHSGIYRPGSGELLQFGGQDCVFYVGPERGYAIQTLQDGSFDICRAGGMEHVDGCWYLFTACCATLRGEELLVALNPRGEGHPSVRGGGELGEESYISGIRTEIKYNE